MDCNKVERIIWLLFLGVIVGLLAVFASEIWFPNDGQMFQVAAGVLSGFLGALLARLNPKPHADNSAAPPSAVSLNPTDPSVKP